MPTRPKPTPGPRGFTLLELMVVIGVIAVLISLLLPAVQSAREGARRVQCVNNLMQLNLAIHNYETSYRVLPPGSVNATGPIQNAKPGYAFGWVAQILPYLEAKDVGRSLNFNIPAADPANDTAREHQLNILNCPSENNRSRWSLAGTMLPRGGAAGQSRTTSDNPSNYAACHHDVEAPIDIDNHGVFFLNSRVRYDELTDGLAQTIFLGEKKIEPEDTCWLLGTSATLRNSGVGPNAPPDALIPVPLDAGGTDPADASVVQPLMIRPNLVGGFSSFHPVGANFSFGDGSVRFLKSSVRLSVFRALCHRSDGELVSEGSY